MLEEVVGTEQGAGVLGAQVPVIVESSKGASFTLSLEVLCNLGHCCRRGDDDGRSVV